ncbi:MAG: branched-chain amino acid transaminase [Vampirovibrionales bacterium]
MSTATPIIYFDQQFVPEEKAVVSVRNHSFLYGTSLFEGIRGYWVPEQNAISIFANQEHFARLLSNANIFGMHIEETLEQCCQITAELIQRNGHKGDTYIRPTIYKHAHVIGPYLDKIPNSLTIFTQPLGAYVDIDSGLSVCVSSWRRLGDNMIPPRAKAGGAYMNTALIKTEALRNGYDEAIVLTQEGRVSEGSAMNLFIVRNGKLVTPAVTENILEGITRNVIIELAKAELGLEVEERQVDRTELYVADEAFFCGTGAQVAPITSIDKRPVGTGEIGPLSKQIQELYFDVVKGKVAKYKHWCTLVPLV